MRVELIEEKKFDSEPWYVVTIDGRYVKGTGNKVIAEDFYNKIINDPEFAKTKVNILKSEEINVPLEQTNQ